MKTLAKISRIDTTIKRMLKDNKLGSLEQNGYLMAIKQRPKIHELSDKIKIDLE